MRLSAVGPLFWLAAAIASTVLTTSARAQNYPWCAEYGGDFGGAMNCGFVSFDQCMETVRGIGGFCVVNNTYVPPAKAAPARPKRHGSRKPS